MDEEKRFWEYVEKMGYPTSAKGLRYGSKKAKLLDDVRSFFHLDKLYVSGENIGWAAGSTIGDKIRRYWDVHLAVIRIVEGKKAVIDGSVKMIKRNLESVLSWAESVMDTELMDWIDEGGEVSMEDIVNSLKSSYDGESEVRHLYGRYQELFGEQMEMRIIRTLQILEMSEHGINWVKKNFEGAKNEAQSKFSEAENHLKKLAKKAGVDYEQLYKKLL